MRFLRRFLIRLSNFATRQSADQRLQEEIAEHLAFQTEENMRAGMSPAEARRQAALKLGRGSGDPGKSPRRAKPSVLRESGARPAVRGSHAGEISRILFHCHRHDGAGHRSHHRHLQRHRRHAAASFALSPTPANWCALRQIFRVWAHRILTSRFLSGRTWRTQGFFNTWPSTFSAPRILRAAHSPCVSRRRW